MPELTEDAISKSLIIIKIFLKKVFELSLCYQVFGFETIFILILLLNHCFAEKQSNKKGWVKLFSSSGFEMVFTLLAETLIIQVDIFIIQFKKSSFKRPLMRCGVCLNLAMFIALDK